MSILLAIETSSERASVALWRDGVLTSRDVDGVSTHSQTVLPMVQELLAEAGITLNACDAIAFGAGPGSFTGVRTACGVTQGLAFGARLPVIPVVTLQAMAQACFDNTQATDIVPVLDARMGEVYWAQYRWHAGSWQVIVPPTLSSADAVLVQGAVQVCGNGLQAYADAFQRKGLFDASWQHLLPHARQTAVVAAAAFARGESLPAAEAEPLYLRNKVALTTIERQQRDQKAAV